MAKDRSRKSYDVSADVFVATWQSCTSADEVAKELQMPKPIVHARASNYRAAGVNPKKMLRSPKNRIDVQALNQIIADLDAQQPQ